MVTGGPSGPYQILTTGGSVTVVVYSGTTYTLTVTNTDTVTTTRTLFVNTVANPTISSFTANGNTEMNVAPNTSIMFRATFANGTALITSGAGSPGISIVTQGGGVGDDPTVTPSTTTTYTLTVTNTRNVSIQRTVTVNVIGLPTITNFTRSPTGTVTPGTSVTFSANYSGTSAYINGTIAIASGIPITIDNVSHTTTYELIVYKTIGSTTYNTSQQLTVDVSTPGGGATIRIEQYGVPVTWVYRGGAFQVIYTVPVGTNEVIQYYNSSGSSEMAFSSLFNSNGLTHVSTTTTDGLRTETKTYQLRSPFGLSSFVAAYGSDVLNFNIRVTGIGNSYVEAPLTVYGEL